jgi:hypothetical protein
MEDYGLGRGGSQEEMMSKILLGAVCWIYLFTCSNFKTNNFPNINFFQFYQSLYFTDNLRMGRHTILSK